jgi:DNA helicase-2/ATP-dependent DNA helicase PcrA
VGDGGASAIAERDRQQATETIDVMLPAHLSVSQLVALQRDPQRLARRLRRPLPEAPDVFARRGTAFHLWLEQRHGGAVLLDLDDLPGSGDAEPHPTVSSKCCSEPSSPVPGQTARRTGRSAVCDGGGRAWWCAVEWTRCSPSTGSRGTTTSSTGRPASGPPAPDATAAAVQLAAYRIAWAELAGVPVAQVGAGFHYVRDGVTVRPADLLDTPALIALVAGVPEK